MKISKSRLTLLSIVISYFTISCLYIIFSDRFLLYLFRDDSSNTLFHEIQSYKGIAFVLLTAIILFVVLRKKDAITDQYINTLKSNKLKYNGLFNNMLNGVVYTTPDGLILAVNKAFLDVLGATEEQMLGQSIYSRTWKPIHGDSTPLEPYEHPIKIAVETQKPVRNAIIGFLNPKTKGYTWLKLNSIPEFEADNKKLYRVLITVDDITSLKNSEDELKNTQEKIKASLEKIALSEFLLKEANVMAKIGVYEINSEKDSMYFSEEMYHIFNIPLGQEYPFKATRKAFKKQSEALLIKVVKECMEKGTPFDVELKIEFAEKVTKWVRLIGKPIYDENNKIIGRRGIMQDVTDLKNNEEALKQSKKELEESLTIVKRSEFLLSQAGKMAKMGAYELFPEENTFYSSEEVFTIFGLKEKSKSPLEQIDNLFSDASRSKMHAAIENLMTKGVPYDLELELTNFKKEEMWIRVITEPVFNEDKKVIGRRGVIQDITGVKRSQLELEISNQKLETSIELLKTSEYSKNEASKIAKIGYWEYDGVKEVVSWSEYVHQIYGSDPKEDPPALKETLKAFDEESQKKFVQATLDLTTKGVSYDIELKLVNLKKEDIWIRNVAQPIFNEQNEVVGRRAIMQNITDSKKIQFELELSKNKLQTSLELLEKREYLLKEASRMANLGYWGYDKQTDTISWSDSIHQVYGTDSKKGIPEIDVILSCYNEESRQRLVEATVDLATNGVSFDIELYMTSLKNEKRWIRNMGEPVYNNKNEIVGRRGISQDITEQKLIREKIEKAEEMYRLLTDNSNDIICLQEPDSTYKYISPSIKNILGYEPSEFMGKQIFSIVHKDDLQSLKDVMEQRKLSVKVMDAFTFRVRHKEGHIVWLEFLTSPVYKEKEISYFVSSSRDVTQWVLAKKEVQKYQTSLQKLTTEITLVEEKQKKEIATNIHDHLSQSLVISKMKINELKKKSQLKMFDKDLKFIETHISEALENSRKITYELSPPVLYQLGIIAALNWLLDDVEMTHKIECRFNSNITEIKLSEVKSILLFRSIQEVITNTIKYANASLITLNVDKNKLGVYILITDNGVGFDTSLLSNDNNHSGSGFGLFTVEERIRNIQGKFTIASEVNEGTVVKIIVPLAE